MIVIVMRLHELRSDLAYYYSLLSDIRYEITNECESLFDRYAQDGKVSREDYMKHFFDENELYSNLFMLDKEHLTLTEIIRHQQMMSFFK
jgi:hypothetical protein